MHRRRDTEFSLNWFAGESPPSDVPCELAALAQRPGNFLVKLIINSEASWSQRVRGIRKRCIRES
jgi:hypothetical protein